MIDASGKIVEGEKRNAHGVAWCWIARDLYLFVSDEIRDRMVGRAWWRRFSCLLRLV